MNKYRVYFVVSFIVEAESETYALEHPLVNQRIAELTEDNGIYTLDDLYCDTRSCSDSNSGPQQL